MASDSPALTPIFPRARSMYQATVEHVEDYETDRFSAGSASPVLPSSRNSMSDLNDEERVEDVPPRASLCRLGTAEFSASLWSIVRPKNFGQVLPGVYRSSFPQPENIPFLQTLGLKTILTLVPTLYSTQHDQFLAEHGIRHFRVGVQANKDPLVLHPQSNVETALNIIMDRTNHPILVHCNQGKHRTGCVIACLRKIMGWTHAEIVAEYRTFAGAKARVLDELFIERFDERVAIWQARANLLLPVDEPIHDSPITTLSLSTRLRS